MEHYSHGDFCDLRHFIYSTMNLSDKLKRSGAKCIIGVTGKSGSGKTTFVNELFDSLDYFFPNAFKINNINFDEIAHLALEAKRDVLLETFGFDVVKDRRKLADLVFNSRHEMKKLNDVVWNEMQKIIDKKIKEADGAHVLILDWILLPHAKKYWNICDITVLIDASYEIRKQRAIKRDKLTSEEFDSRERNSIEYDKVSMDFVFGKD